jgi:hypothetical protein
MRLGGADPAYDGVVVAHPRQQHWILPPAGSGSTWEGHGLEQSCHRPLPHRFRSLALRACGAGRLAVEPHPALIVRGESGAGGVPVTHQ